MSKSKSLREINILPTAVSAGDWRPESESNDDLSPQLFLDKSSVSHSESSFKQPPAMSRKGTLHLTVDTDSANQEGWIIKTETILNEVQDDVPHNLPALGTMIEEHDGFDPNTLKETEPRKLEKVESAPAVESPSMANMTWKTFPFKGCLFFTLLLWASVALIIKTQADEEYRTWAWIFFGVTYFVYFLEVTGSVTSEYLKNIESAEYVHGLIGDMRSEKPLFWWHIQCYHYEIYYRRKAKRQRRKNTHEATGYFVYNAWRDRSPPSPSFHAKAITRTHFFVRGMLGDEFTREEYDRQRNHFQSINNRDRHYEFSHGVSTTNSRGVKRRYLTESQPGSRPFFMKMIWFSIISVSGFSFPYRMWMEFNTGECDFWFTQEVFCMPEGESKPHGSTLTG